MAIGRFYFSGEELCRFGDSGDPGVEDAHWCLWEEVEPALATKDAEIARLKAENAEARRLGRAEAAEIITSMNPSVFINDCSGTRDDDDFWIHKKIAELLDTGSAESLIEDQLHAMVEAEASAMELREEVARLKAQRDRLAWYFGIEICRFEKAMGTSDDARRERARKELADIGLRIVGGQVEEVK